MILTQTIPRSSAMILTQTNLEHHGEYPYPQSLSNSLFHQYTLYCMKRCSSFSSTQILVFPEFNCPGIPRSPIVHIQYTHMLEASNNSPIIFLQYTNFVAQRFQKLRQDIADANIKFSVSLSSPTPTPVELGAPTLLAVMQTSLFGIAGY
jgi:hypothetical protein